MIRLTALLCGGIFLVLQIAGQDNGQVRQGLITPSNVLADAPSDVPEATIRVATEAPRPIAEPLPAVTEAVFVPIQPVRVAPVVVEQPVAEPAAEPAAPPEPDVKLAVVNARSVNVRAGPSTDDAILGRLTSGDAVLVVAEVSPVDGWSLVRIEGDGIQGYVASRLLQDAAP